MKIETLIYIYGAVCLSMIGFNILYSLLLRRHEPRLKKRCQKIQDRIETQLDYIRKGEPIDSGHFDYLRRSMSHINNLIAFDRVLSRLLDNTQDDALTKYLLQIRPSILYLAVLYYHRDSMQTAFFSFFLTRYITNRQMPIDSIQDILLEYIKKNNLYCSVNALQALYTFGNADHIISALKILDESKVFVHEKILTDGLLTFTGNHDDLIPLLWQSFESYSEHMQLAILNYIRFKSDGYQEEMLAIAQDKTREKELRLSAIRYFGKYYYEPALDMLISFAQDKDLANWEYANVCTSSLMRYGGERVIETLKQALHSSNWYIRKSASVSLEAHGADYSSMMDIIAGNDRYAREMMTYQLETHRLQKAGDKL